MSTNTFIIMTETQSPTIDPEVATALAQNPDAAHFAADLASGTPLAQAVKDHFSHLLTPQSASQSEPQSQPQSQPEPAQQPAPTEELYQSPISNNQPIESNPIDNFLSESRPSFWA
jgi:hypothetical protein